MFAPKCKNDETNGELLVRLDYIQNIQNEKTRIWVYFLEGFWWQDSFTEWVVEKGHEFDSNPTSILESAGRLLCTERSAWQHILFILV